MKVIRNLIFKSAGLSACLLFVLTSAVIYFEIRNFGNRLSDELTGQVNSASIVAAQNYSLGDLIALKSNLDNIARNHRWDSACLKNINSETIWTYSSNLERSRINSMERLAWTFYQMIMRTQTDDDFHVNFVAFSKLSSEFPVGELRISKNVFQLWKSHFRIFSLIIVLSVIVWIGYLLLHWFLAKRALKPIQQVESDIDAKANQLSIQLQKNEDEDELMRIRRWFLELSESWLEATQKAIEFEKYAAVAHLAEQVAHDIKSPLAALRMISANAHDLTEEKRILVQTAISRISEVANDLPIKHSNQRGDSRVIDKNGGAISVEPLWPLIEAMVFEKQVQFQDDSQVKIQLMKPTQQEYFLFSKIQPNHLRRALSNIINNAREALRGKGTVSVSLGREDSWAVIGVQDDGRGIPADVLPLLSKRGMTFGKSSGVGLGLYHARITLESVGGSLEIRSEQHKGTSISVKLPIQPTPEWLLTHIDVDPGTQIVILDDDVSIHTVWKVRFSKSKTPSLHHFYNSKDFSAWVTSRYDSRLPHLFLVDFQLGHQSNSGLDLIEKFNLSQASVLVTSQYTDESIRTRCERLQMKIIPKSIANQIPIASLRSETVI